MCVWSLKMQDQRDRISLRAIMKVVCWNKVLRVDIVVEREIDFSRYIGSISLGQLWTRMNAYWEKGSEFIKEPTNSLYINRV